VRVRVRELKQLVLAGRMSHVSRGERSQTHHSRGRGCSCWQRTSGERRRRGGDALNDQRVPELGASGRRRVEIINGCRSSVASTPPMLGELAVRQMTMLQAATDIADRA
jgi:hypothetical protein